LAGFWSAEVGAVGLAVPSVVVRDDGRNEKLRRERQEKKDEGNL
jgi:hypothetical protein